MQTSYPINQGEAFAGLKVDSRFDTVESHLTEVDLDFGLGVMSGVEDPVRQVRLPSKIKSVLTADADLVSLNSTIVTINGDALSPVVFLTDHATTMALIAVAIAGHASVLSATVTAARVITAYGVDGIALTITAVTTLGVSQPGWTAVASDPGVFRGIALHRHVEKDLTTGVAKYKAKDVVDVSRKGNTWMKVVTGVTMLPDQTAYLNLAIAGQEGKITNVSSNNIATGGVVRKVGTDPDGLVIAQIEINLP